MKFFSKEKKVSDDLTAELQLFEELAKEKDPNAVSIIQNILTQNQELDPYAKKAGGSSLFERTFDNEDLKSLYKMYQHKPDLMYKSLLDTLASEKLLEEMQNPSPSIENIQFLLEAGADPTKENTEKQSALTIANEKNKIELLHIMSPYVSLKQAPFYVQNATQQALFKEATKENPNYDNIKFLIEKGADPFLKLPDTREANRILEEKVKEKNPNIEQLDALLKEHDENSKKAKEVSAFDILAENPVNLKSLHLMYQKLPKELEQDRTSYSKTLTDVVKHKLQQSLINQELNKRNSDDEFSFTQFNQIVAEAEKSELPEVNEFAAKLMLPHFTEAFKKDPEYTINDYYLDNPGVLVFDDLSELLGKDKADTLRESSSIELASDEEFKKYMISNAEKIINQYADTTASNKYTFLKTENPNLNDQELLDKFVPKEMQQDIFHTNNPNKVLEETVTEFVGQENIEQFKLATKIEILTESQITRAIEQQNEVLQVQKVEAFLDRAPLLTKDSYYIQGPQLINFALKNVNSNPQLLRKTIETIKEQNKNNPSIIENMVERIVTHSNGLKSPAEALQLHSVLRETDVSLPDNYKLGQLSKEELEALQTLTTLTKDRAKFLEDNCSAEEMKQLHNTISKLPLQKLPTNISEDIISLIHKSTQHYFDKEIETSQNIVRTIEDMVEVSKNSPHMLAIYATETPEILRNHLTHITANNITSAKEKSPTKLHKQKMAEHEKKFHLDQKELRAKADRLEQELKALPPVIQPSNLMTIDATKVSSPDQLELYSEKRKKDIDEKQAELLEAKDRIDQLSNNYHAKKLKLEKELNGKELSIEQKKYDKKLEQFHQFLSQKPNLKDSPSQSGDLLSSHVLDVAIENIDQNPRIMDQAVTLFKEQYKQTIMEKLEDYRKHVLRDYPDQQKQLTASEKEDINKYLDKVVSLIKNHYNPNSVDGNARLTQKLVDLSTKHEEFEEFTKDIKKDITTPSFPQISKKIRAKLRNKDTTAEQTALLTKVLVEQLNESPPINEKVLQYLHDKKNLEELGNLLRNARQYDISKAILDANNDLAKYIYLTAPKYEARNHLEVSKLVGIALKEDNDKMLSKIVSNIINESKTVSTQEEQYNKLLSVELLQSLHKKSKLEKLFGTKDEKTLEILKNQVVNNILESKQDIDPNLICDVLKNTQEVDNDQHVKIANIVLSDKKKIGKLSKENIEILAPHYNSLQHNPLFLKELIDIHDTSFEPNSIRRVFSEGKTVTDNNVIDMRNKILASMTSGSAELSLPEEFDKSLKKYLKTKRSVFKAFFRDQDAKITKRIGELDRGSNYFKAIMSEWADDPEQKKTMREKFMSIFGFSKEKEKTLTLDTINSKEDIHRVLKDAAQKETDPALATKIFHKAMQLEAYLDEDVKESIKKLAEIAYKNRETGDSPQLTNQYIDELYLLYPSDKFYQQAKAELQTAAAPTQTEEAKEKVKQDGIIKRIRKAYKDQLDKAKTYGTTKRLKENTKKKINRGART